MINQNINVKFIKATAEFCFWFIDESMTPSVSVRSVTGNKDDDGSENVARNKFAFFQTLTLLIKKKYIYIYISVWISYKVPVLSLWTV